MTVSQLYPALLLFSLISERSFCRMTLQTAGILRGAPSLLLFFWKDTWKKNMFPALEQTSHLHMASTFTVPSPVLQECYVQVSWAGNPSVVVTISNWFREASLGQHLVFCSFDSPFSGVKFHIHGSMHFLGCSFSVHYGNWIKRTEVYQEGFYLPSHLDNLCLLLHLSHSAVPKYNRAIKRF